MFEWKKNSGWLLSLFLIGFAIYAFNLGNPLFWDDDDWIINNPYVHSLSGENIKSIFTTDILHGFGLNSNYYRPLLLLSFAFNWVLHGSNPIGYHVVSNLFHVANAILIFLLLNWALKNRRASFIASLLWLVHPLNVEAVTNISGRGDPMSVFFILGGLLLFASGKKWWAIVPMVLAVLSRETAILFPALAMVLYISFVSKDRFYQALKKSIWQTLPYWGVSVGYMILRLTVLNFQNTLNFYSQANIYSENLIYRLYTFGAVLVEYLKLILWPTGLHMERNFPVSTSIFQYPVWLGFLTVLAIFAAGLWLFKNSKIGNSLKIENSKLKIKETNFRIWFFGWSWFFIAMSPVSGIIPINAIMYEHWLYLPLIGLLMLAGYYLDILLSYIKNKTLLYRLAMVLLVGYLVFLSGSSMGRNLAWGNTIEFYEDVLKYNPNTVRIINNLGNAYAAKGNLLKAAEMYERAIQLPDGQAFAQPYYNLANTYRDQNKPKEASEMYIKAIEVDPNFPFAYKNLAVLYTKYGFFEEAIKVLKGLKNIRPDDSVIDEAIKRLEADLKGN